MSITRLPARPVRPTPSSTLLRTGVIAVLRARHAHQCAEVIEALTRGGVPCIELTLSTPGVLDELPRLVERFGDQAEFGVGTVTTPVEAIAAMDAGARYLVTPLTEPDIVAAGVERGVAVYPGGLTPTELFAGWSAGATAVKVFPASVVGPGYVAMLRGPFPDIQVIPSGGVGINDAAAWIRAGAMAVSIGGPLIGDAFDGGDLEQLRRRAAEVREAIDETRAAI